MDIQFSLDSRRSDTTVCWGRWTTRHVLSLSQTGRRPSLPVCCSWCMVCYYWCVCVWVKCLDNHRDHEWGRRDGWLLWYWLGVSWCFPRQGSTQQGEQVCVCVTPGPPAESVDWYLSPPVTLVPGPWVWVPGRGACSLHQPASRQSVRVWFVKWEIWCPCHSQASQATHPWLVDKVRSLRICPQSGTTSSTRLVVSVCEWLTDCSSDRWNRFILWLTLHFFSHSFGKWSCFCYVGHLPAKMLEPSSQCKPILFCFSHELFLPLNLDRSYGRWRTIFTYACHYNGHTSTMF